MSAEKALLGAMLLSEDALSGASSMLAAEDFASERDSRIFQTICRIYESGHVADPTTVFEAFGPKNKVAAGNYLLELQSACTTSSAWESYAHAVKHNSLKRRLKHVGALLSAETDEPEAVIEKAMVQLASSETGGKTHRVDSLLSSVDLTTKTDYIWSEIVPGVHLHRGDMFVVGARPGVGKTAFAAQLAKEVATRHIKTRIYTFEMSAEDYLRRFVQQATGWGRHRQDEGLSEAEAAYAHQSMDGDWQRFIEIDDSNPSLETLTRQIRRFAAGGGWLVIIDHIQILLKADFEAVTEGSRRLKLAANDSRLNTGRDSRPIVCVLSQLNRGVARDDGTLRPPALTDLKQSGAIEQDADQVLLLHHYQGEGDEKVRQRLVDQGYILEFDNQRGTGEIVKKLSRIEVAKNRHGRLSVNPAWFDGDDQTWSFIDQRGAME